MLIALFFQFLLGFSQANALGLFIVLCLPALSAGMLHAFHMVETGHKPMLAILFKPFFARASLGRLLLLGGVVMVTGLLTVSFSLSGQVMDIDPEIIGRIERGDLDALQLIDPQVFENAILAMAAGAAVGGCLTYFAVPLIWFGSQGLGVSVLTGLRALGRNWRPLLLLGLVLGLLAMPVAVLFAYFYLSALGGAAVSSWLALLLMLLGPLFHLMVFATQYLAFRDIFGLKASSSAADEKGDQLVA
jgi:uncharacterized membrane protein